ncbi:hypothetical protein PSU4_46880 [Pseudonocardia sulfidoxydans NBRC 16205]|uniref:Uncharacterized protein n=1 Tax=Pseudonocardia sulfidoxydans NBRC 16205 TaxID=1223511 RepID=A0A511DPK3_9PSEU|nr:hypothetical protein [Pseudonocardia sulfidoxydans]GEL25734.1 hypothetical protein PSU4_46880 [Pseudonocardia sulfidoxydans NBRC 16205]
MFRTATTTPAPSSAFAITGESAWREFDDRDAHQDRIASDLAGALDEPGL